MNIIKIIRLISIIKTIAEVLEDGKVTPEERAGLDAALGNLVESLMEAIKK